MHTSSEPTWKLVKEGIERICCHADEPTNKWVGYAGTCDYTDNDLYITLKAKAEENVLDSLTQMLRSQDVFTSVSGKTKTQPRYVILGKEGIGPKRKSKHKRAEYQFHINLADDTTPETFHREYIPKPYTTFDDLNGFGEVAIEQLQDAGYEDPSALDQEDLNQIHEIGILSETQLGKIANKWDLINPSNTESVAHLDVNDEDIEIGDIHTLSNKCGPLTALDVENLVKAGFNTIASLKDTSNEALLKIDNIGNATVYDIRDEFSPDDVTPNITRF